MTSQMHFGCLVPEIGVMALMKNHWRADAYSFLTMRKQVVQLTRVDEFQTKTFIESEVAESSMGEPQKARCLDHFNFLHI
jgi:hypothetical protein